MARKTKNSMRAAVAVASMGAAGLASAASDIATIQQGQGYVGLYGGIFTVKDSADRRAEPNHVAFRAGTFLIDQVAAEVEVGTGFNRDDISPGTEVEMDHYVNASLVGHLPLGEKSSVYAKAGFADASINVHDSAGENSTSENGFSYGFGLAAHPTEKMSLAIEYSELVDGDSFKADMVSIGIQSHFSLF
ncbi:porin family protein [Marinobacter halodurans]|uniref:Porin family protein n=1 Tax=Marinobacter halodurans TaxID=2528979 RepID=A0ABY1ZMF5_9GAMM|nr:porin family protein [Marinobacter halodurans]TBW57484.1 porin family protein [Marinobacter halodurans]